MPFTPIRGRCLNCKKFFMKRKENQRFHDEKCRMDYHNNGKTPQEQMVNRLKRYLKSPAGKELIREAVAKELRARAPLTNARPE